MVDKADDAIAMWQQMVGEMQKGFRAFGDQLSRGSSDRTAADPDSPQKRLADLMESYFVGMNLPSRAQLDALSDRLQNIESELAGIKALLQGALTNSRPAPDAPKPARPRPKRHVAKGQPVPAGTGAPPVPEGGNKPE